MNKYAILLLSASTAFATIDGDRPDLNVDEIDVLKPHRLVYDSCPYAHDIIAATIIMEAGGEYHVGALEGVYEVIMNRAEKRNKTPAQVCLQRKQFSCWNGKADGIKALEYTIAQAKKHPRWKIAVNVIGTQTNYTKGADHYYADYIAEPYWASSMKRTVKIGKHIFFK
jgi:spore germination cell wall hydrolase CwlJ-like protein